LAENFGERRIEDLSLPFFAVSTNLSRGTSKVHMAGGLAEALRASIALPGILPPKVLGREVHVDGAVLNNFPVDVMRDWHRGLVVGVDVAQEPGFTADRFIDPPDFAGWVSRHGFSAPPPIADLLMRAATVSVNPNAGRDNVDVLMLPDLGNLQLQDWKAYDRAVEAGYEAATQAVLNARGPFAQVLTQGRTTRTPAEVG
jgi:NTE family protein